MNIAKGLRWWAALNFFDFLTTLKAMEHPHFHECNPLIAWVIATSVWWFIILKVGMSVAMWGLSQGTWLGAELERYPGWKGVLRGMITVLVVFYSLVAVNNLVVLGKLGLLW
jgi:hypothetical protein